jgi:hypothetical protein
MCALDLNIDGPRRWEESDSQRVRLVVVVVVAAVVVVQLGSDVRVALFVCLALAVVRLVALARVPTQTRIRIDPLAGFVASRCERRAC